MASNTDPSPRPAFDATAVRDWARAGLAALEAARAEIDELNVYPVPDGDTGTNLHLTMVSALETWTLPARTRVTTRSWQPSRRARCSEPVATPG